MSMFKRKPEPDPVVEPEPEPVEAPAPPQRTPILHPGIDQATNRYLVVGTWALAEDVEGRAYQTGEVDRTSRCYIELSGGRRAERGEVIAATPGEAQVLSKRFVLSLEP